MNKLNPLHSTASGCLKKDTKRSSSLIGYLPNNLPLQLQDLSSNISGWAENKVGSLAKNIKKVRKRLYMLREADDSSYHRECTGNLEALLEKLSIKKRSTGNNGRETIGCPLGTVTRLSFTSRPRPKKKKQHLLPEKDGQHFYIGPEGD